MYGHWKYQAKGSCEWQSGGNESGGNESIWFCRNQRERFAQETAAAWEQARLVGQSCQSWPPPVNCDLGLASLDLQALARQAS